MSSGTYKNTLSSQYECGVFLKVGRVASLDVPVVCLPKVTCKYETSFMNFVPVSHPESTQQIERRGGEDVGE